MQTPHLNSLSLRVLTLLGNLGSTRPTQQELDTRDVDSLDRKRNSLQYQLMEFTQGFVGSQALKGQERAFYLLVRHKLHRANGLTIVSGKGEQLHLRPFDKSSVYNLLALAHRELDELRLALLMAFPPEEGYDENELQKLKDMFF